MPMDSFSKPKPKASRAIRRHRSATEGGHGGLSGIGRFREDMEGNSYMPPAVRQRLHELFSEIEKEFEKVCSTNVALQEKVDVLTATAERPIQDASDAPDAASKAKKPGSQISQRIKTTYKVSTSKIVSSFRTPSTVFTLAREFRGHRDGVWEVSVAPRDLGVIGTASADHSARVFCVDSGQCMLQYLGHQGSVNSIRFHPTQDLVLTAAGDEKVHVWRLQGLGQSHGENKTHSSGEDDNDLVEGSEKEDAPDDTHVMTVRSPLLEIAEHNEVVVAADWMNNGTQIISASWDRQACLADAETGNLISMLTGHYGELTEVRAHPSQQLVVTSSKDTTFRLWDLTSSSMQVNVFQGHTQPVTSAVFAGHDKVVSGSDDRTVKVWDLRNMRSPITTIRTDSAINRLSVSQGQQVIAIPHDNRHIRLFDIHGTRMGRLPRNNRQGHTRMVCSVSWAEDFSTCNLFSCGFDRQVFGWNVNLQNKE